MYPRPRGECYVTGFPDPPIAVTELPGEVEVRPDAADRLERLGRELSSDLKEAPRIGAQSCYLPLTADGEPAIGELSSAPGIFVGTGHSCWGILNAPATGKLLAELILDGKSSAVLSAEAAAALAPGRLLRRSRPKF